MCLNSGSVKDLPNKSVNYTLQDNSKEIAQTKHNKTISNMARQHRLYYVVTAVLLVVIVKSDKITDETIVNEFLEDYEKAASKVFYENVVASWQYQTNLTQHNKELQITTSIRRSEFRREAAKNATLFDWQNFSGKTKRLFSKIADAGIAVLDDENVARYEVLESDLEGLYSKAKVCNKPNDPSNECYPLDPDLTELLTTSRDWKTLSWAWKGWRDATGPKMKEKYIERAVIENKAARMLGHSDAAAWWTEPYEDDHLDENLAQIWNQLKPLYEQLHTYVRRKLQDMYIGEHFPSSGHIPAHLLGDMWAQEWGALNEYVLPYPNVEPVDVTKNLVKQNYTALRMFQTAEEFFTSLGMEALPQSFWDHSMLVKPADGREVVCHGSAWDFRNSKDFRVKMCTFITNNHLHTIHHELGHVYYFLMYKHQPLDFKRGANPGFHEAIGDVILLSSSTPEHLHKIGLLDHIINDTAFDVNFLMSMALNKVAFLPFGYLIDQWRWNLFRGEIKLEEYNEKWWELRCGIQGMSPPVARPRNGFDAGSKYHIPANTPYIRYFVSHILQFQFHKSLCEAAGYVGPLHRCDIYNSSAAGEKLMSMLSLGSSVPWQDVLEQVTGTRTLDASALLEYFQPIMTWLQEENKGHKVGWDDTACPPGSFIDDITGGVNSIAMFVNVYLLLLSLVLGFIHMQLFK